MPHPMGLGFIGEHHPLLKFSVYTFMQAEVVIKLGQHINSLIKKIFLDDKIIDAKYINDAHGEFWLWTLGSYEILRTMKAAKNCWTPEKHLEILELEQKLARIRVPFAKQEIKKSSRKDTTRVVEYELSIVNMNLQKKDFGYRIEGEFFYPTDLIKEFELLIANFRDSDVLKDLRDA